ncbi:MAG: VacJ family lipoprotein [Elusimicrobia bacterium]|nr:VacJ family lipoprotein [Elusimicrobiota bacterium]
MTIRLACRFALLAALAAAFAASGAAAAETAKKSKASAQPVMSTPAVPMGAETGSDAGFEDFESEFGKPASGEAKKVFDPLSGYNRAMYHFNDKFYLWVAKPLAIGYGILLPEPGRVAIARGFTNLAFPVRFVGAGMQGKVKGMGTELGRFLINSTLGLGGLFDPAEAWFGLRLVDEDLGQAFGKWGMGTGFPVVLPILGQTNLRDGVGLVGNSFLTPLNPVYGLVDWKTNLGVTAGGHFNYISLHVGEYEKIKKDALDPYTFIRDAHLQNRAKRVKE